MLDSVGTILILLLAVLFWLGLFGVVRAVVRGIRACRFLRAAGLGLIVLMMLWIVSVFGVVPGASFYGSYQRTRSIFGHGFVLGAARRSYSSHGLTDGYGIAVYDLPDAAVQWVNSAPPEFSTKYPQLSSVQSSWTRVGWRPTPISSEDEIFLNFATNETATNDELQQATAMLRQLAREPGHYFAYLHTMRFGRPEKLNFFLISPERRVYIAAYSSI